MTSKTQTCTNCNEVIKGNLILNCACNHTFCSQECCTDFHSLQIKHQTNSEDVKIDKTADTIQSKRQELEDIKTKVIGYFDPLATIKAFENIGIGQNAGHSPLDSVDKHDSSMKIGVQCNSGIKEDTNQHKYGSGKLVPKRSFYRHRSEVDTNKVETVNVSDKQNADKLNPQVTAPTYHSIELQKTADNIQVGDEEAKKGIEIELEKLIKLGLIQIKTSTQISKARMEGKND